MSKQPEEDLLWRLSEVQDGPVLDTASEPTDEDLRAYRAGTLSAADVERIEQALVRSPRSRARLAVLGGVPALPPPARVRARVLGESRRRADVAAWAGIAAALVAAALVAPLAYRMLVGGGPSTTPVASLSGLAFTVRVEGLAPARGEKHTARAFADTPLRIVVEPEREARAGLVFALYRESDGRLERLDPGARLTVEESRGSAVFTVAAGDLVGAAPGDHSFFVVASGGTLPATVDLEQAGDARSALAAATGGIVTRASLTVVPREVLKP